MTLWEVVGWLFLYGIALMFAAWIGFYAAWFLYDLGGIVTVFSGIALALSVIWLLGSLLMQTNGRHCLGKEVGDGKHV